ncbi:efflux RND transporter permease subunit [Chitinophaga oryziterrae]|nr:efflux RND transporter permease subunit [Chitinophaga oryziterrae]
MARLLLRLLSKNAFHFMIRYFVTRPVAILSIFFTLILVGVFLVFKVPVSLLPNIDVPFMVVRVNDPNASAQEIENRVLKPIRERLGVMGSLVSMETQASNHAGLIRLGFDYRADMALAYIEVNEKIDLLSGFFPPGMERPQVIRLNTTDIPVLRVQVLPAAADFERVSELTERILKRRLEQLPGVSVVDVSGQQSSMISLTPDVARMSAFKVHPDAIVEAVELANQDLGGLNLKRGQYQFFVRLQNRIKGIEDLAKVAVKTLSGDLVALDQVAVLRSAPEQAEGFHLFNGKPGLVVTVQAQAQSRMNDLVPLIKGAVADFRKEYPSVGFELSQDQSFLLDAGISNLEQDIVVGGLLTIVLLFLFLGNYAAALLMSISIPVSLVITFIFFYVFGLSFNIISLSGLALGVGMLIDNSIVIVGHITRKRIAGLSMLDSCVQGTNEMTAPVLGSVITTVVVYEPLVLLSGLAGALIKDQCIALTISLGVSLLVAFVLTPTLYALLLKAPPESLKEDTVFYTWVQRGYHRMISFILLHRRVFFVFTLCLMPLGFILAYFTRFESLPYIEKRESLAQIDWNEPVSAEENLRRTSLLLDGLGSSVLTTETDIGATQFLFQQENNNLYGSQLYFSCRSERDKLLTDARLAVLLRAYPRASLSIVDAPNAFTQLFVNHTPFLEAKFTPLGAGGDFEGLLAALRGRYVFSDGPSLVREPAMTGVLDVDRMNLYSVRRQDIDQQLQVLFGRLPLADMATMDGLKPIVMEAGDLDLQDKLNMPVRNVAGVEYPLNSFIRFEASHQFSHVCADRDGPYQSIVFREQKGLKDLMAGVRKVAALRGYAVSFSGRYFENEVLMMQMVWIFLLVVALLYTVLAIQFESFLQPVIVMLTIPIGVTGAMFLLCVSGGSLNVMAAIGFVVVLGLVVDDPLLKIETLNRLKKGYLSKGETWNEDLLYRMIHEAGDECLKPLLLVSLTTSIAVLPVLFFSGIGNDLQAPMAVVMIGGLSIGTFFTTWFVPLAYWYSQKWFGL